MSNKKEIIIEFKKRVAEIKKHNKVLFWER